MNNLMNLIWIEQRKAFRSRVPLWTALGSLFMPLGIAFLIYLAKTPALSQKLGLVGAKANLLTYAGIDWAGFLSLFGQIIAAGGFIFFMLIVSWVFGREFADGTVKDLLAVPVRRSEILLAKFIVSAVWSVSLAALILVTGMLVGAAMRLPGGSAAVFTAGVRMMAVVAGLTIVVTAPFAFVASAGRGYLLPFGVAVVALMMGNLVAVIGWGPYFPWAVPGLYTQADPLPPVSYWIVLLTGLAGMAVTYLWWLKADQNR